MRLPRILFITGICHESSTKFILPHPKTAENLHRGVCSPLAMIINLWKFLFMRQFVTAIPCVADHCSKWVRPNARQNNKTREKMWIEIENELNEWLIDSVGLLGLSLGLFSVFISLNSISFPSTKLTSFVLRHIRQESAFNYLISARLAQFCFSLFFLLSLLRFSSCFWAIKSIRRLISINLSTMIFFQLFPLLDGLMMTGWHMAFGRDLWLLTAACQLLSVCAFLRNWKLWTKMRVRFIVVGYFHRQAVALSNRGSGRILMIRL